MQTECARGAQRGSFAGAPTGFRRLTPGLLKADRSAEGFNGMPEGITMPGQLLAAFKSAAPWLGLSPRLVHAVDWLFRFTQPQDWGRGGRPIVWPSASMQRDALGLSESQVKATNRALIEAGLITMKDSPNGKRYGRRDGQKRITEAYGFDLSPMATRYAEFVRVGQEAKAERADMARLRRRATIARNGITQILETAAEYRFEGEEWQTLSRETRNLTAALRKVERSEELAIGVASLERRQRQGREQLEALLADVTTDAPDSVDFDPKGPENQPHIYNYKPSLHPERMTVIASEESKSEAARPVSNTDETVPPKEGQGIATPPKARTDQGTVMKLSPEELTCLAPRLRLYLKSGQPAWPEIVDAAEWLRGELGVSKSLWGEACLTMGREAAAIAIAIVSAKPAEHFRSTPGGYFHGMVVKAKTGQLNLTRTIWAMRQGVVATKSGKAARRAEVSPAPSRS
jgi:replication initiation protein RepC